MKKGKLLFLFLLVMLVTSLATTAEAKTVAPKPSIESLEKQIKALKEENAKLKERIKSKDKEITSKDKQIKDYKNQIAGKDKEIQAYKSNAVTPLKTKLAYQGNVLSGNYQEGKTSVPLLLRYKGIRYTPVDAISNLLKIKNSYDRSSDTVFFGQESQSSYMSDILEPVVKNNTTVDINKPMDFGNGNIYDKGYSMTYKSLGIMEFNLDKKYKKVTGLIKIDEQSVNQPLYIFVTADDKRDGFYKKIATDGVITPIELDVSNVSKLEIMVECTKRDQTGVLHFANVIIE
ncbi:coiled-coil domain-containing protein [Metabacillus fastidiosus]|uniref:NPCBM/NEW2 domain-containing protein n=1 Tax=Metabacillus fastidiosus TaxID=1458 RepID=A0ABU6NWC8_9BACI|nr:NPCBM/NEW2 domain-containing protein [Metabacillus fastidiosus]MED4401356.1 NPCBM/NEW2 domain-containing protein [Metabacillus fastidiosus]MED4462993.1 NPCBM/NEW2 domain-containing protein [Metabacillus fastidiosus]